MRRFFKRLAESPIAPWHGSFCSCRTFGAIYCATEVQTIRQGSPSQLEAYERQHGVCPLCGTHFELSEMEADHVTPWRDGGRTVPENCQMLCRDCNRRKGAK